MLKVAESIPICRITRSETSCSSAMTAGGSVEGYWWRRKHGESGYWMESRTP